MIILGSKHSGKRSLVDSLFDIAKTTLYSKRQSTENKMRVKGATTGIDYAYLNVIDMHDPDNSTNRIIEEPMPSCKSTWLRRCSLLRFTASSLRPVCSRTVCLWSCLISLILGTSSSNYKNGSSLYTSSRKWHNSPSEILKRWPKTVILLLFSVELL